jgi:hypothetical protein
MLTVGDILGGGFPLLRDRPGAVASWSLLYALVTAAMTLALQPYYQMQAASPGGAANIAQVGAVIGRFLLVELFAMVVFTILAAAAFRAVLRPRDGTFGYLRVGMDELRLFALTLLFFVALYLAFVVGMIVLVAIGVLIARLAAVVATGVLVGFGILLMLGVTVWLEVRFSLAFPLTLMRHKIIIGESWRLTRGRFWTLFGAFFVIFLLLVILWIVAAAFTQGSYLAELARGGFGPEAMRNAAARQAQAQLAISPLTVVGWAVSGVVGGLTVALFCGCAATAAQLLTDDTDRIADTFA